MCQTSLLKFLFRSDSALLCPGLLSDVNFCFISAFSGFLISRSSPAIPSRSVGGSGFVGVSCSCQGRTEGPSPPGQAQEPFLLGAALEVPWDPRHSWEGRGKIKGRGLKTIPASHSRLYSHFFRNPLELGRRVDNGGIWDGNPLALENGEVGERKHQRGWGTARALGWRPDDL